MSPHDVRHHLAELSPQLDARISDHFEDVVIEVGSANLLQTASELLELGFDRLGMVTAVDTGDDFEMVYRVTSRSLSCSAFVKTRVGRIEPRVASLCPVWPAANWQEREVWDLFGIHFTGHPDMRRILLPEEWPGWPLRKDYDDPNVIRRPDYI
ncbi:MAG: NADH-quinone oxidoreductase subunit C [Coriobacteriia bacterium]|nr:NADH-quinone oxidoreductase subunit C [Coriobacteriia bacterium]